MKIRRFGTLFVPMLVGAAVFVPSAAIATNGAQFTSLSAEYVELDLDPDDFEGTEDDDGHADDLIVTFTETGIGNSKVSDLTVTATREATVTCIAPGRTISVLASDPLSVNVTEGEDLSDASASFTTDQNGHLVGTVFFHTTLATEVCPYDPNHAYVVSDYSLVYTNVTVTDNENGASASTGRLDPGYSWSGTTVISPDLGLFGFTCTIEEDLSGNCHSS